MILDQSVMLPQHSPSLRTYPNNPSHLPNMLHFNDLLSLLPFTLKHHHMLLLFTHIINKYKNRCIFDEFKITQNSQVNQHNF
jgi:hypothetical protein